MKVISVPEDKWEKEYTCPGCGTVYATDQNDLSAIDNYQGGFYVNCPTCHRFQSVRAQEIPVVTQIRVRKTAPEWTSSSRD